jgi:hypothetical protein
MPVIMDQRDSWFVGAVGAMLVAGAVFFGVVMGLVYERMLGVCFEHNVSTTRKYCDHCAIALAQSFEFGIRSSPNN